MKKQNPARIHRTDNKLSLIKQIKIVKMLKRSPFKYARQLFPVKDLQKSVDKLGFDKNSKKIKIINLIKSIFYNIVIYDNTSSRHIAKTGNTKQGFNFSKLVPVSHVAILDRLMIYCERNWMLLLFNC